MEYAEPGLGQGRRRLVVASGCHEREIRPCVGDFVIEDLAAGPCEDASARPREHPALLRLLNLAPDPRAGGHLNLRAGDKELPETANPITECDGMRRGAVPDPPSTRHYGRSGTSLIEPEIGRSASSCVPVSGRAAANRPRARRRAAGDCGSNGVSGPIARGRPAFGQSACLPRAAISCGQRWRISRCVMS